MSIIGPFKKMLNMPVEIGDLRFELLLHTKCPITILWLSCPHFFQPERKRERERCKGEGVKCSHEYKNLTSGMASLRKHQQATQIESRDKQSERDC